MTNLIELGCCDAGVSDAQCKAYLSELESTARVPYSQIKPGVDKVSFVDGRVQHSVLLEIFTDAGVGTEVVL